MKAWEGTAERRRRGCLNPSTVNRPESLHHRADPCDRDTGEGGRRVTILISVASGTILSRVTMGLVAGPRADTGAGSPGGCCGVVCVGGLRGNSQ